MRHPVPHPADAARESDAARALARRPPWRAAYAADDDSLTDRAMRARVRRWSPQTEPPPELIEALGEALGGNALEAHGLAGVRRLVVVLHLLALAPGDARPADSFGRACALAGMLPSRFSRLVTTPRTTRVSAVARALRQIGAAGIRLAPDALPDLYAFLFTARDRATVTHWARHFFANVSAAETAADPA